MLVGSLFENEQDAGPLINRDDEQFSDAGLTDDEREMVSCLKIRLEACSQPKCMSSQTQYSAQAQVRFGPTCASKMLKKKAEHVLKSYILHRTATTLQVRQLTLSGTCVLVTRLCKYCKSYKYACRRPGTILTAFHTGSSSRAWLTTSQTCPAQAKELATYWVFTVQDRKRPGKEHEERPSHQFC